MSSGPATAHLPASPAVELHAFLDRVLSFDADRLTAAEQAELVQAWARAENRIAASRLQVLAAADHANTASLTGAASTGQWAARLTHTDQADAARQVRLAQGLASRTTTRQALAEGLLSAEHAEVIIRTDRQLPEQVTVAQRNQIEATLVQKARMLAPTALRKAARRALAIVECNKRKVDEHENDIVTTEEERARAKTRLAFHSNDDGTITGHFTIPTAQGELLKKVIETMTAPRRGRLGAPVAQVGEQAARTDWDRARGEAFLELIEHLPTDHLHPRTAATLVVTLDEDTLRGALKAVDLDTGGSLSAGEARRLACSARILPAILDGKSLPLDLGRSNRLFTDAQRTALSLKHTHCAADGCERPYAWCELHHLDPWSRGGKTDLANGIPLCQFHHQRIHDPRFEHRRDPDGSITFHRRTVPARPGPGTGQAPLRPVRPGHARNQPRSLRTLQPGLR